MRNSSLELDAIGVEIDIDSLRSTKFGIDSDRMRTAMVRSGGNDAARYHAVIPGEVVL